MEDVVWVIFIVVATGVMDGDMFLGGGDIILESEAPKTERKEL